MTNMHLFDDESLQIQQSIVVLFSPNKTKENVALGILHNEEALDGAVIL